MKRLVGIVTIICVLGTFFGGTAHAIDLNKVPNKVTLFWSERQHDVLGIEINPAIERKPAAKGEVNNIYGKYCGVTVLSVQKGSLAEKIGIQKGDFIYRICGTDLIGLNELIDGTARIRPHRENSFDILRNGEKKHISFQSDDTFYKDNNYLFLLLQHENKYAERRDILLLLCNTKQTKNMKFFGMLVFLVDVKQLGNFKQSSFLFLIGLQEGERKPIVL